jgi:hypothetical protein
MARPLVIRGVTFTYEGRIAWEEIARLLAAANAGTTTPDIDAALEAVAAGAVYGIHTTWLPRETQTALNNLGAHVRAGACSIRRCPECTVWFLAFKKTQHTCRRSECRAAYKKADARHRAAASRRIERERQRIERARVTKTGT